MRLKMVAVIVSALFLLVASVLAADISGTWVGEMAMPEGGPGGGPMTFTFNFNADGAVLTGKVLGPMGNENEILDGKIEGDALSFSVKVDMQGNEMKINYKGTVSGDDMKLTLSMEGGMGGPGGGGMPPMEIAAKRQ